LQSNTLYGYLVPVLLAVQPVILILHNIIMNGLKKIGN